MPATPTGVPVGGGGGFGDGEADGDALGLGEGFRDGFGLVDFVADGLLLGRARGVPPPQPVTRAVSTTAARTLRID